MEKTIPTKNKISPEKHIKIEPFRKGALVEPEGYVIIFKNTFLQQSRDESLKQLLPLIWHASCLYLEEARDPP